MPRAAGDSRTYDWQLNGNAKLPQIQLTSVTTILRDVLGAPQHVVTWATKFEDKEALDAFRTKRQEEGTAAHSFVEDYTAESDKASPQWPPSPATGFDEAFLKFVKDTEPTFLMSEAIVFSLKHAYAGTLDLALLGEGGTTIICDVKTRNKNIYKAYDSDMLQCRAYAMAAYEMGLIAEPEAKTATLMLKENGRYTYDETSLPNSAWLAVLSLWRELKGGKS